MNVMQMADDTLVNTTTCPIGKTSETRPIGYHLTPRDVLHDRWLTHDEKREILASWASDRRAVPNAPSLRRLDSGALLHVDEVLRALKSLDAGDDVSEMMSEPCKEGLSVLLGLPECLTSVQPPGGSDDDEDDPPPCPAMIAGPRTGPLSGGETIDPALAMAA